MFDYTDPTGGTLLDEEDARVFYRARLHGLYTKFAELPNSGFTLLEAFDDLAGDAEVEVTPVEWRAFPLTSSLSPPEIDEQRFVAQDEYVEWRTERDDSGRVVRVTFSTEFPEYYEALAERGVDAVIAGIREVIPEADPTLEELFGSEFDPQAATPEVRARRFRFHGQRNPWNNGEKGILFLSQQFNTLGALFNLLGHCGINQTGVSPNDVCGLVRGACGPGRASDPRACSAAQELVRNQMGFSLADPAGVEIVGLDGIFKLDGEQVDLNDADHGPGLWRIERNGRRGVLEVPEELTLVDDSLTSGADVARSLRVRVKVAFAPEGALPAWARTGAESTRRIG